MGNGIFPDISAITAGASLLDSGLGGAISGYAAQFAGTAIAWMGIIIPASIGIWLITAPVKKGIFWLRSQVFR
jgi:hypothetical protein